MDPWAMFSWSMQVGLGWVGGERVYIYESSFLKCTVLQRAGEKVSAYNKDLNR